MKVPINSVAPDAKQFESIPIRSDGTRSIFVRDVGSVSDSSLQKMSGETGGHVFRVDRKHTLEDVFKQLQEEMRSQYAIGYAPTNGNRDGSFRRIEIHTRDKEMRVHARKGYYAVARAD